LIGRLNQPAADGFFPLRAFKPSSSESAERGRSIIQVKDTSNGKIGHFLTSLFVDSTPFSYDIPCQISVHRKHEIIEQSGI
jgi:hypothetical protein